jgi:peptidoglycan/LPS O-acetylase OafA/YrhL
MDKKPSTRVVYVDWLRVLGVLAVLVYHSSRFFNPEDWHVKNPITYEWLNIWNEFALLWLMPLLFAISGLSLFFAVGKSGPAKFVKDKVLRLLVPLLVGMFTHCALQVYLERLTHGQFSGTFFQFLPYYFQGYYNGSDPATGNFARTGMHLWYLAWLFVFTLVLYPLMLWLQRGGKRVLAWLGTSLSLPGAVYLLALPVIAGMMDNEDNPFLLWWEAGWPRLVYLWLIFCGFLVGSSTRLQERVQRLRWLSLALALVTMVGAAGIALSGESLAYGTVSRMIVVGLRALSAWCWVLAFLGLGRAYLTRSTPFLSYANEAVLPFYILHQTVLLCVGYFVVQWAIPGLLKWVLILILSFSIIMVLYEFLVRRYDVMRFLFGMKPLPRAPVIQAQDTATAGPLDSLPSA